MTIKVVKISREQVFTYQQPFSFSLRGDGMLFLPPLFCDNRTEYRRFGLGRVTGFPADFGKSHSNQELLRASLQRFLHCPGDTGKAFLTLSSSEMETFTFLSG